MSRANVDATCVVCLRGFGQGRAGEQRRAGQLEEAAAVAGRARRSARADRVFSCVRRRARSDAADRGDFVWVHGMILWVASYVKGCPQFVPLCRAATRPEKPDAPGFSTDEIHVVFHRRSSRGGVVEVIELRSSSRTARWSAAGQGI